MNRDADLLAFAVKWRHWGGGSRSDIFVEFGISPDQYFRRLARILDGVKARELAPDVREELRTICRARRPERAAQRTR
ncbi:DUF3263 domain-containing protein [Rhodococcus sp. ACS1]|uniref:DUF3263 domain-containing protein n=1 Tax=unclassified Rhodococcus (in: high G+C Gram-positive bacteria) TaxID=192944 RepID=UPI00077A447D|nr:MULTISPECIES: DUF3263 domain-containing protein [unclassified Rhodococcus (in: high G+C Gram-positive bacteria)]KXX59930.1 hypothetical protein AZG88_00240 [Rhodococcus sp. LB1]PBC35472.1 DUF3263 domain-containing protein [Rhodococcus sp. ACS1]